MANQRNQSTAPLSAGEESALLGLKKCLETGDAATFEQLAADLISVLLDVPVFVARTGYQFGADAGTAGVQGRRLRIECKRYLETTALDARSLKGELVEASQRDPQLEAWVLMSTRTVKENDRNSLVDAGLALGIPVVILDWTRHPGGIPSLAALCAGWPQLVQTHYPAPSGRYCKALGSLAASTVDATRRDLQVWSIGFKAVRIASIKRIDGLWARRSESLAYLNQDAAGGAVSDHLKRRSISDALSVWFSGAKVEAPMVLTGLEGVGKTWAALHWTVETSDRLPIVLVVPSSAMANPFSSTEAGFLKLLAGQLQSLTRNLNDDYWKERLHRLLERPVTEGPAIVLIADGVNQQPDFPWVDVVRLTQGEKMAGRIRLVMTSRTSYFEQTLGSLRKVNVRPDIIRVGSYDLAPGSEFDQMLAHHKRTRSEIPAKLHGLAATPRLFPLVVRLAGSPALQTDASITRLLWEYGRDTLQSRFDNAFDEDAWVAWLVARANVYRAALIASGSTPPPAAMTRVELATTAESPEIARGDVARRLSDIIDNGHWVEEASSSPRRYVLKAEAMTLALSLALLDELDLARPNGAAAVRAALASWLDPIAPIDEATDVLRAAASVLSASDDSDGSVAADAILIAWMHSQNQRASHGTDVAAIGDAFPRSLLGVIERSGSRAHASALNLAAQTLRRINVSRVDAWAVIQERLIAWCTRLSCPKPEDVAKGAEHYAESQSKRLTMRIQKADPGIRQVMGVPLHLDYVVPGHLTAAVPAILEGHKLKRFANVFVAAAVANTVFRDTWTRGWEGLRWLIALGAADPDELRDELRRLSKAAFAVELEPYVLPEVKASTAALLLWLCADEADDLQAASCDPRLEGGWDYQKDYLDAPARGFFEPEHRHAVEVLEAHWLRLPDRLKKTKQYWPEPGFPMPASVVSTIEAAAELTTFIGMDEGAQRTVEEASFKDVVPAIARFSLTSLVKLAIRRLDALAAKIGEQKYWAALRAREFLLLIDSERAQRFGEMRARTVLKEARAEAISNCWLVGLEMLHLPPIEQMELLADVQSACITLELLGVIEPATLSDKKTFLRRRGVGDLRAVCVLLQSLTRSTEPIDDELATSLLPFLEHPDETLRVSAFVGLAEVAPQSLGNYLLASGWRPDSSRVVEAHYGSFGVMAASHHLPFEDVVDRVAPWKLLDAALQRGDAEHDIVVAASALGRLLGTPGMLEVGDLDAELSISQPKGGELARYRVTERYRLSDDPFADLQRGSSVEDQQRNFENLAEQARSHVDSARASGGALFLQSMDVAGVEAAWTACPDTLRDWLSGMHSVSEAFLARLRRAEGVFVSLCEVLLKHEPETGKSLWRLLRRHLRTRFVGTADIDELVHMIFRVPGTPAIDELRRELLLLQTSNTDRAFLDIVIAAKLSGCEAWLQNQINADGSASELWRRKRGIVLAALASEPDPHRLSWPEGPSVGSWESLRRRMHYWSNRGALARHWCKQFLEARTAESAFAAWQVFLSCVDRRAWVWLGREFDAASLTDRLGRLKILHTEVNRSELESAMQKKENESPKFAEHLFGIDAPGGWLTLDGRQFN